MRQLRISQQITNRDDLSLDLYLHEISKERLLTVEEEVKLTLKLKNGDPKAVEMLVKSNLRFVVSVAKQYQHKGLTLSDLINEGNLGLIKAAERFDNTRGFKFISYAVWWIRQSILLSIAENSRVVRMPMNKIGTMVKVRNTFAKLEQDFHRDPMPEEIAELLMFKIKVVEEALQSSNYHISIDAPIGENDEMTLQDFLINHDSQSPDLALDATSLKYEVERILTTLLKRESQILSYYFGLQGEKALGIDEIALRMGTSRERVRQIKDIAIRKLKKNLNNKILRPFLG